MARMGTDPKSQPPELPPEGEKPPPFQPDYDIITLLEGSSSPRRVEAYRRALREHQERRAN